MKRFRRRSLENGWTFLARWGLASASLGVRLSNDGRPVFLDVGADYHHNGTATYLREGDIVDQPDGSVVIYPRRTDANLWSFRVGVSVGI